jgi:magnesium chelatase family protein
MQAARAETTAATVNAGLAGRALRRVCTLDARTERLLHDASERLGLTARSFDRLLRVSRTIADLRASPGVAFEHVAEALQFRSQQ